MTPLAFVADVGIFVVIVIRLLWRRPFSVQIPTLARAVVKDVALYVLLLCTARITFVFLSVFGSVRVALLPCTM